MQPAVGDPEIDYSALEDRSGLLSAIFSREGVLNVDAGQLKVTQRAAGANFSVDIAAGRCAVDGDDISDQGTYLCTSTVTENRATPDPPASGTHQHRVVARVRDKLHNGAETTYDWVLEVLADDGTGLPALPGSAIHLATVTIVAGATSVTDANITNEPNRATVGTLARAGGMSTHLDLEEDADRPFTWQLNPDGWVSVAGWAIRRGATFTALAGTFYEAARELDPAIVPSPWVRDFTVMTQKGPTHGRVNPSNGLIEYRYLVDTTITQNVWWFSLDGTGWRL
jgi:hypothetical protein